MCLHDSDGVVVKYCRNIFGWELVGRIADEQACLADSTVTDDNASVEWHQLATCTTSRACAAGYNLDAAIRYAGARSGLNRESQSCKLWLGAGYSRPRGQPQQTVGHSESDGDRGGDETGSRKYELDSCDHHLSRDSAAPQKEQQLLAELRQLTATRRSRGSAGSGWSQLVVWASLSRTSAA